LEFKGNNQNNKKKEFIYLFTKFNAGEKKGNSPLVAWDNS